MLLDGCIDGRRSRYYGEKDQRRSYREAYLLISVCASQALLRKFTLDAIQSWKRFGLQLLDQRKARRVNPKEPGFLAHEAFIFLSVHGLSLHAPSHIPF